MARSKGSANLAASLEVLAGAPLDARLVVDNLTDLITASTFPYSYVGMPVAVKSEEKLFMLIGTPTTNINNWKEIGETCKPEIHWGYLYNNKMYEESAHTTEITAETDTLYITKDTDKFYKFDGTDYVQIGGGVDAVVYQPGGSYLFANIPALSAATLGFVYDVSDAFTTTSDFLEGAGIDYPAGTNIVVVNVGTSASPVYKYDVLIGELSGYQKKIQYTALPTATADYLGQIFQYMGETDVYHTNGHFYKCVSDGETPATYSWEEWSVQDGVGGGHSIKDNGAAMDARASLNFIDFDLTDNSGDDETDVAAHRLTSEEMAEIMSTLPGVPTELPILFDETGADRVVGWYKNSQGLKKPVYEVTINITPTTVSGWTTVNHGISNVDKVYGAFGVAFMNTGYYFSTGDSLSVTFQVNMSTSTAATYINDNRITNVVATFQYTKTTDTFA